MSRRSICLIVSLLGVGVCLVFGGCVASEGVQTQADVERLRNRIAKVRYAISETRSVIAQSRGASYTDELYTRLAELQSEEAQYHYLVAQRRENADGAVHAPQVRFLKEEAIAIYERILRENPGSELGDRILFNIAHEYRELGNFDEMISTLQRLIDNERYSESRYRIEALLVLGDYHFDRNEMQDASRYFRQILDGPDSPLQPLAQYKLGWVYVNDANCKLALDHFEQGIDSARQWAEKRTEAELQASLARLEAERAGIEISGTPLREEETVERFAAHRGVDVRREALVDMIYCYSTERPAKSLITFLRERAYNRGAYIAALERAAARYGVMDEAEGGAAVARELLRLAPDSEDRLDDARMLHAAVTRNGNYLNVGDDTMLILRAMRRRSTQPVISERARNRMKGEFEVLARDLATKAQTEADEESDEAAALAAARAYRIYLLSLPDSEHRLAMTANLADSLALAGEWLAAGRRYREVADLTTDAAERDESYFESVAAYQKVLLSDQSRSHLERVEARAGMRKAGLALLRTELPADKAATIRFAVGQTYYDEGRYGKAIDLLTAVAFEFPNTPESDGAINLVLDSHNTLNDNNGLIKSGRLFLLPNSPASPELRSKISEIVKTAGLRLLEDAHRDVIGDTAGSHKRLLTIAELNKGTALGEQALLRLFDAARAEGHVDRMYDLSVQIAREYPRNDELPEIFATVGRTASLRFEFERALDAYEKAAEVDPRARSDLYLASGLISQELADYRGAARAYRSAMNASDEPSIRRDGAIHLADLLEMQGSTDRIIAVLSPLAPTGDPEILSRLGLAEVRAGRVDDALDHLDQALDGAGSGEASARAQYAQAELSLAALSRFRPASTIEGVEEIFERVTEVEALYLGVVQQSESSYTFAALARVAYAYGIAAQQLSKVRVSNVSGAERHQIQEALASRREHLSRQSEEVLGVCAERVLQINRFDKAARSCLANEPPASDPALYEPLAQRRAVKVSSVEALRNELAINPSDVESLEALGARHLQAGDFHVARLILTKAVEAGGGPDLLNQLGLAAAQAGDTAGALEAFSRAASGDHPAASRNFAALLQKAGLPERAAEARRAIKGAASPEQLLPYSR